MKNHARAIALCALTAVAGTAFAQDSGVTSSQASGALTRAQVEADLAKAIANGETYVASGIRARDLSPGMYPKAPGFKSTETRAEVDAHLADAARQGDLSIGGETALREKDLTPGAYPRDPVMAGRSRAQVESELMAAIHDGDISTGGELGMPQNSVAPAFYAQRRSADASQMAQIQAPAPTDNIAH
jgi:hypothetical protein